MTKDECIKQINNELQKIENLQVLIYYYIVLKKIGGE